MTLTCCSDGAILALRPHLPPPERDISAGAWQKHPPVSQVAWAGTSSAADLAVTLRSRLFP